MRNVCMHKTGAPGFRSISCGLLDSWPIPSIQEGVRAYVGKYNMNAAYCVYLSFPRSVRVCKRALKNTHRSLINNIYYVRVRTRAHTEPIADAVVVVVVVVPAGQRHRAVARVAHTLFSARERSHTR